MLKGTAGLCFIEAVLLALGGATDQVKVHV